MPKGKETSSSALVINGALLTNKQRLASFQKKTEKQLALIARNESENVIRRLFIGLALHVIKESLTATKHGSWTDWMDAHALTAMSRRQIYYIMAAAVVWIEKGKVREPEVAALPSGNFSLKVRDGAARRLVTSATEFVGSRTWGELLADEEIRDGTPSLGGARKHTATKAKPQSAEQLYLFARDEIGTAIETVERVFVKENLIAHLVDHREEALGAWESLDRVHHQVKKAIEPLLKK